MSSQDFISITWTVLPNGKLQRPVGDEYCLTVFVSPRLRGPKKLGSPGKEYQYFLNWPATVRKLKFGVLVEGDPHSYPATPASLDQDAEQYWKALFTPDTRVEPFQYQDLSSRHWQSYPLRDVLNAVKSIYQDIAVGSPFSTPGIRGPSAPNDLVELAQELGLLRAKLEHLEGQSSARQQIFTEVARFFNRGQLHPQIPRDLEFHELVSALGDHPTVLRKLALAIDLVFTGLKNSRGKIRLKVDWGDLDPSRQVRPWTHYTTSYGHFRSLPRSRSEYDSGYLRLGGTNDQLENSALAYDLVQVDTDGAAIKLLNFADSLERLRSQDTSGEWPFDRPNEAGLPALRTGGLALVRRARQDAVGARLKEGLRADKLAESGADDKLEFYLDDLVRGYRVDVLGDADPNPAWRSLCERAGDIIFPETKLKELQPKDEGYVKSASAATQTSKPVAPGDTEQEATYLHESLFRWEGWSLCATRPGLTQTSAHETSGGVQIPERLDRPANRPQTSFPFVARYTPRPNSLPRLRFGRNYRMAVRAVDLAGNSLPLDQKPRPAHQTDQVTYQRFEPVPPPVLVPRAPFGPGESLERLVIRSAYGLDDKSIGSDSYFGLTCEEYVAQYPHYEGSGQRHIVPPKGSVALAETHGVLDHWLASGDDGRFKEAYAIALKDEGTLESGGEIVAHPADPGGNYVIHTEEKLSLPYLPDPAAVGAAFWQHTEVPSWQAWPLDKLRKDELIEWPLDAKIFEMPVSYEADWPNALPFRLTLCEASSEQDGGTFKWDADRRELSVCLAKAQVLTLRCSSLPDDLDQLGMWRWLKDAPHLDDRLVNDKTALAALLWLLTPYRTLTLVHAVQRPWRPKFRTELTPPTSTRPDIGSTYAWFTAPFYQHTPSTGRIELLARWSDPYDRLDKQEWENVTHDQVVVQFPISRGQLSELNFGETHGQIPARHEFGDTKFHKVDYQLRAATCFREYFSEQDVESLTTTSAAQPVEVLSSARPAPPKVAYVVPTFSRVVTEYQGTTYYQRKGGGLRVYMERPWYSSGAEEMLAVVLRPASKPLPESEGKLDRALKHMTYLAVDPLWRMADVDTNTDLDQANFYVAHPPWQSESPATAAGPLVAAEPLGEGLLRDVNIAAFPVEYQKETERWFCDINISDDKLVTYFPFIRLALARYQPHSLPTVELSPIVQTDFVQLTPSRQLTVKRQFGKPTSVVLEGYYRPKPPYTGYGNPDVPYTQVHISAETFDSGRHVEGDPLGWIPDTERFPDWPRALVEVWDSRQPGYDQLKPGEPQYGVWSIEVAPPVYLPHQPIKPLRFVITEYEVYSLDETAPIPSETGAGPSGLVPPDADVPNKRNRRPVYVETVDIFK